MRTQAKKKWIRLFFFIAFLGLYIARVLYINKDNALSDIDIYHDNQSARHDNMEISMVSQKLYELPAYAEAYPDTEEELSPEGNTFVKAGSPEAYDSLKYILEVKLRLKNCSSEEKEIDISGYQMTNKIQTLFSAGNIVLMNLRNDAVLQTFAAGEEKEIVLCYDMLGIITRNLTYERLKNERLAIILSGYPHPKQLTLDHLELVQGKTDTRKKQAEPKETVPHVQKEDTPAGTVVAVGGEVISQGIGTSVVDMQIVENVNEYAEYNPDGWDSYFREDFLKEDGTATTIFEVDHGMPDSYYKIGYQNYFIFIKLRLHNYSGQKQGAYLMYDLLNSKDDLATIDSSEYVFVSDVELGEEESSTLIEADGDMYVTLGYARSIRKDCDIYREPLYISNEPYNYQDLDLSKGKGGYGRYLQVQ